MSKQIKHIRKSNKGRVFKAGRKKMVSIRYAPDSIQTGFHLVPADEVCPRCGGHIDGQEGCSTCSYGYQP